MRSKKFWARAAVLAAAACLAFWLWMERPWYRIDPKGYAGLYEGMSRSEVESHLRVESGYYARDGIPGVAPMDEGIDYSPRPQHPRYGNYSQFVAATYDPGNEALVGGWFGSKYAILVEYDTDGRVQGKALYRVMWIDWMFRFRERFGW